MICARFPSAPFDPLSLRRSTFVHGYDVFLGIKIEIDWGLERERERVSIKEKPLLPFFRAVLASIRSFSFFFFFTLNPPIFPQSLAVSPTD